MVAASSAVAASSFARAHLAAAPVVDLRWPDLRQHRQEETGQHHDQVATAQGEAGQNLATVHQPCEFCCLETLFEAGMEV